MRERERERERESEGGREGGREGDREIGEVIHSLQKIRKMHWSHMCSWFPFATEFQPRRRLPVPNYKRCE